MKIERLELRAYGCFTDTVFDFAGTGRNMVVIYGPNEAGKSTSLNAIRHWLFGFDKSSKKKEVDFLHKNALLRILGTVSAGNQTLTAIRKKGNKDTLLAADNKTALKDGALDPFLKSITATQFEESFGLDLARLAKGGEELAAGKGDLGEALFSAASGVMSLQKLRASIGQRKDALFSPRASNPVINAGLKEYTEAEKTWKASLVSAKDAVEAEKAVAECNKELDAIVGKLSELRKSSKQLGWLARARNLSATFQELSRLRAPLAGITVLRPKFESEHLAVVREHGNATARLTQLADQLKALDAEIAGISIDNSILAEAEVVSHLVGQQATIRKIEKDLSEIGQLIRSKKGEAKQSLRNLRLPPDDIDAMREKLRLSDPERRRLRQLATEFTKLTQAISNAARDKSAIEDKLAIDREKLETSKKPGELESLQVAYDEVSRARDPEGVAKNLGLEIDRLSDELERTRTRLKISLDERAIATTRMPGIDEISHHREKFDAIDREMNDLLVRERGVAEEMAAIESRISLAEVSGAIPCREDLLAVRANRDAAWEIIRHAWLDGKYDANAVAGLTGAQLRPEEFTRSYADLVRSADDIGDRLAQEADRVGELVTLRSQLEAKRRQATLFAGQTAEVELRREKIHATWRELWSPLGVTPTTPRDMNDWRRDWDQLVERHGVLSNKKVELARVRLEIDALSDKIRRGLTMAGETAMIPVEAVSLLELTDLARRKIKAHEKLATDRTTLEGKVHEAENLLRNAVLTLNSLQEDRVAWEKDWGKSVARLVEAGITEIPPEQIDEITDGIAEFFGHLDFIRGKVISESTMKSDLANWNAQLEETAIRLNEPTPLPHSSVLCSQWHSRLKSAESSRDRLTDRRTQRDNLRVELQKCELDLAGAGAGLQRLAEEAKVQTAADLPEFVTRSAELANIDRRIENEYRKPFDELAAEVGSSPEVLQRQGAEATGRDLQAELANVETEIEVLDQNRGEAARKLGEAEQLHKEITSRRGGIDHRAQMETALARVRQNIPEYATLALAEAVLARAIERYRERNKSDLFETASQMFRRLTCDRFAGLDIEQGDNDEQLLVGVRPDGSAPDRVLIKGMSDGTRDQLYLALRLAHLKKHVTDHGPFPIIVDDLLLTFDDTRSKAALHCLAELSRDTQVIFFTHHEHLKQMAEAPEFRERIGVLEMGSAGRIESSNGFR